MAAGHVAGGRVAGRGGSDGRTRAPEAVEHCVDRGVAAKAHEASRAAKVAEGTGMGWLSP